MSEKQRDVKEIAAEIANHGINLCRDNYLHEHWMRAREILTSVITTALQTERDRAKRAESERDAKWQSGIDEVLGGKLNWNCNPTAPGLNPCDQLRRHVETLRTRAEKAEAERDTAIRQLGQTAAECGRAEGVLAAKLWKAEHDLAEAVLQRNNLLCRIHRDGGHYIAAHGVEKACEDADLIVAQLNCEHDALAEGT